MPILPIAYPDFINMELPGVHVFIFSLSGKNFFPEVGGGGGGCVVSLGQGYFSSTPLTPDSLAFCESLT